MSSASGNSLYAAQEKIYPREVDGFFARFRILGMVVLLGGYYAAAWLQWDGRQALLFDLPARKFYVFGLVLWPQDFFFLSWLWKRARFDGQVFWTLVILEGVLRFATDFARYYEPDQLIHVGPLIISDSQLMAVGFVLVGVIGMGIRRQRAAAQAA